MNAFVRRFRRALRDQQGIALLIVLMVTTVMTVLILDLHQSVRINFYIASNLSDGVKAAYLVRSGVQVAAGALLSDRQDNSVDSLHEDWYDFLGKLGMPGMPVGDGTVIMEINDESGRFNLNAMVGKRGTARKQIVDIFRKLLEGEELDPDLANAVVDWIDADEESFNEGGTEDAVYGYEAMEDSVTSKNAPFDSLQEVRLVAGITDEVWQKLEPLVTIYGDAQLNLNTAEKKVMKAVLKVADDKADTSIIDKIIEWREGSSSDEEEGEDKSDDMFSGLAGGEGNVFKKKKMVKLLVDEVGMEQTTAKRFARYFTDSSRYFRVTATALVGNVQKTALGIIQRSKSKAKIVYYRVAPGLSTELQKKQKEAAGTSETTPTVQELMQQMEGGTIGLQ
ncbi:MAG TPA: type II secretion system minor pseudopilin GspK [bacterium]|nr:type II secretion system minor pseudopilin GspK [bacterium]